MRTLLTFVHALSPLHAGIGQGAGVIDMPIAREKATGLPYLPGSSLKGALRTRCDDATCKDIFGADPNDIEKNNRASSVLFTDQRLLCLPVRSVAGTFAWVTSPYTIYRFLRDVAEVGGKAPAMQMATLKENKCLITTSSKLPLHLEEQDASTGKNILYLEDFDLEGTKDNELSLWAEWLGEQIFGTDSTWRELFNERLCVVADDIFNFVSEHCTEISARIRLQDDAKTVADGGLWYEETLPTESILSGMLVIAPSKEVQNRYTPQGIEDEMRKLASTAIQLGGKATTGHGFCHVQIVGEKKG